jgi:uncharacterized RDD family membrane protein YckC
MAQQDILDDFIDRPRPASIGKRMVAAIIDGIILLIVFVVTGNLFGEHIYETTDSSVSAEIHLNALGTFVYIGCWFLLLSVMEGRGGQTIGKKALRIKVIQVNGATSNIGSSFLRHFFDFVDCFFLIGLIVASNNPLHKRIADNIAGTCVVDAL